MIESKEVGRLVLAFALLLNPAILFSRDQALSPANRMAAPMFTVQGNPAVEQLHALGALHIPLPAGLTVVESVELPAVKQARLAFPGSGAAGERDHGFTIHWLVDEPGTLRSRIIEALERSDLPVADELRAAPTDLAAARWAQQATATAAGEAEQRAAVLARDIGWTNPSAAMLQGPRLTGFLRMTNNEGGQKLFLDLFDERGRYRGLLRLDVAATKTDVDDAAAFAYVFQVVSHGTFDDGAVPPEAKEARDAEAKP